MKKKQQRLEAYLYHEEAVLTLLSFVMEEKKKRNERAKEIYNKWNDLEQKAGTKQVISLHEFSIYQKHKILYSGFEHPYVNFVEECLGGDIGNYWDANHNYHGFTKPYFPFNKSLKIKLWRKERIWEIIGRILAA